MNSVIAIVFFICLGNSFYEANMAHLDVITFFNIQNNNLSSVTWAHAVNNKTLLSKALNSNVMMIEADVVIGTLLNGTNGTNIPIMAHPPANTSDLSLGNFLSDISSFNEKINATSNQVKKGVKLDFKSIEAFENSISNINTLYQNMTYPVWINADILSGPLNANTTPVDATRFLNAAKNFTNSTLSIGWTTNYGSNFNATSYTNAQIVQMIDTIKTNNVNQSITFPVRAGIAAESLSLMQMLVTNVTDSTLTIWSSEGDQVNVTKLRELIKFVGLNKTYIDVPQELEKELNLNNLNAANVISSTFCKVLIASVMLFRIF